MLHLRLMPRRAATERLQIDQSERVRIPLAAERLQIRTRTRRTGVVRVRTVVERRAAVVDPPLRRQNVQIARRRIDRFVSMSNLKYDALVAGGVEIGARIPIPDDLVPPDASVEMEAKKAAGYFTPDGAPSEDALRKTVGRDIGKF